MKGWDIKKMHDHCKECAECAAHAMEQANEKDAAAFTSALSTSMSADDIQHQAWVTRLE